MVCQCCSHVGFLGCSGWCFLLSHNLEVPGAGAEPGPGASLGSSRKPEASCCERGSALASQQGGAFVARRGSSRSDGPRADNAEMGRGHCLRCWRGS